ncbi:MAG TPA: potassium channel protein [Chroococcales cyanobacterium]
MNVLLKDRLIRIVIALLVVLFIGVVGYQAIEGWPFFDALYMTVITIASVGFGEVHPLSDAGRSFTMLLILIGGGVLVYCFSTVTAYVVEGELSDARRTRTMEKKIDKLKGHYIVCGADQTARYLIEELGKTKQDFVVIEKEAEKLKPFEQMGFLCVKGDATHDATLLDAGIYQAKGLITALRTDADNLFVALTAKGLNPNLRIISKAVEEESEMKLRRAGADGVIMPHRIGAMRMVSEMLRPSVVTFLDLMLRSKDVTLRVEDIEMHENSPFLGMTIAQTGILEIEGVTVVAVRDKENSAYRFNPSKNTLLNEETILIVMGNVDLINATRARFQNT